MQYDRKTTLVLMRTAGYHGEPATFTRLFVESKISRSAANAEYQRGQDMRLNGVPCVCRECAAA